MREGMSKGAFIAMKVAVFSRGERNDTQTVSRLPAPGRRGFMEHVRKDLGLSVSRFPVYCERPGL
jgi:hypothetical protein